MNPHRMDLKYIKRWAKIIAYIGGATTVLIGGGTALGIHGPQLGTRVNALEDSARLHSTRIDSLKKLIHSNIRISCRTLTIVAPREVLLPEECVDDTSTGGR